MTPFIKKAVVVSIASTALLFGGITAASAAPGPNGPGQPGASCGSPNATSEPAGFASGGFANAETVYAGVPGTPSAMNGSPVAVSQYDVACFQLTTNGH
jgi:hypothetical protein